MRPQILYPLFTGIESLPGIGKSAALAFSHIGITRVLDLLFHLPAEVIDRGHMPPLSEVKEGEVFTTVVHVEQHFPPPDFRGTKIPYRVICRNDSGFLTLVFFNYHGDYLLKTLPPGEKRVISGRAEIFSGQLQVSHPDYIAPESELAKIAGLQPVYGLTEGIGRKKMESAVASALQKLPDFPEWLEEKFPAFKESLFAIHNPKNSGDILSDSTFRKRLAFDELLAAQIRMALVRKKLSRPVSFAVNAENDLRKKLISALPFALTKNQIQAIQEITVDMQSGQQMMRLLQGDVGSGKTIVALIAMLDVVSAGKQAALMAPTEILARQHHERIEKLTLPLGLQCGIITSRTKNNPDADIIIGTHALLEEKTVFKNLGFAVIDEQHRFGVKQRITLASKGAIHMLLMSATPIPRTLAMTYYGDMEISSLAEKPEGRTEIDTRAVPAQRYEEVLAALRRAVTSGAKAYWICPLVADSEKSDLAAAEARFKEFQKLYGKEKVGLIHGRMRQEEKEKNMATFATGGVSILVATTVIEVGIDVPEASIIIIEHAERFGLAQLHQLRGRVGRGEKKSTCLLLYSEPLGEIARARLNVLRETNDGFFIAEEDLRLRGGGEMMGARQSGRGDFKVANMAHHRDLLLEARDAARKILADDPMLASEHGKALRLLLEIFEYADEEIYLQAG